MPTLSMPSRRLARGMLVLLAVLLASPAVQLSAQAAHNWHTLSNGMDVVYTIEQQATTRTEGYDDVPVEPVVIESVMVID